MRNIRLMGRRLSIHPLFLVLLIDVVVFALLLYLVRLFYAGTPYYSVFIVLSILVAALLPFGYFYSEYRKTLEREKYYPQFLKDVADVYRSGVSLVQAVYEAAKQNYGALTPQVKKLAVRLSWGIPFEKAFEMFSEETKSPLIKGVNLIILEAFASGGDVAAVLETVAEDVRRFRDIKEERKSRFAPFIGTMYVVFFISIFLSHILLNVLLPEIPVLPSLTFTFSPGATNPSNVTSIPQYTLKVMFLHLLLIQAVVSGLIAGIIGEGSWTAGLKHVLLMSITTILIFNFFVMPTDPVDRIGRTVARMPTSFSMSVDMGKFYVEKNITAKDVEDFVEKYSVLFGRKKRAVVNFDIMSGCAACGKDVIVKGDGVYIRRPTYLSFRVVSNGDGTITVLVG